MYGFKDTGFIIDTSRNGKGGIRDEWGSWCNIKGAGLGERPRAEPSPASTPTSGSSRRESRTACPIRRQPRFDEMCAGRDAAPGAPQAGQWFESYFLDLVRNANPPL